MDEKQYELESLRAAVSKDMKTDGEEKEDSTAEKMTISDEGLKTDKAETPSNVRRRRIIDRNVKVDVPGYVDLNASALIRECEAGMPKLNYSYSHIEDSDLRFLQERLGPDTRQEGQDGETEEPVRDMGLEPTETYSQDLENPGNNRKFAKFIRDVTKPKSILMSTSHRSNKVKILIVF